MVSPDKMFNPRNLTDYEQFVVSDILIFIEKQLLNRLDEYDFLIPYSGRFRLFRKNEKIIIK